MLTSINTKGQKVIAQDATRLDKPFYCPSCSSETVLKQGLVKAHHFAHKPPITCEYGQGESEAHRECKQAIYNELLAGQGVTNCELEKSLGVVRPDVYFERNNQKFAIEVQVSALTMEKIIRRTQLYNDLGIFVLWLSPYESNPTLATLVDECPDGRYAPKQWEKWLHATYFGRVYYWYDSCIYPVHFSEYQLYVEDREWYTSDAEHMSAGGYYRISKKYRSPSEGITLDLLKDFHPTTRKAWKGGNIIVPDCKLLIDKQEKWWK